jgi:hypothetical protein
MFKKHLCFSIIFTKYFIESRVVMLYVKVKLGGCYVVIIVRIKDFSNDEDRQILLHIHATKLLLA